MRNLVRMHKLTRGSFLLSGRRALFSPGESEEQGLDGWSCCGLDGGAFVSDERRYFHRLVRLGSNLDKLSGGRRRVENLVIDTFRKS
ncbi:hypothetical protein ACFOGG_03525 [Brenneria rubrifaciens]|uniref:hypothetical protein n=1 Tax=Brenneria rubrifaciens TaxID=55213 RepID=UPI00360AA35E